MTALTVLSYIGGLFLAVLSYIWLNMISDQKEHRKDQKIYNDNNDTLLKKIIETQHEMQLVSVELKTIVKYHTDEIEDLKKK